MRQVTVDDAPKLAELIGQVWADHNPNSDWIARVSLESNHATLIEEQDGDLIGFVDAFSTVAADGTLRWEVDLLGVHPDWRGRGIARWLVARVVEIGWERGAQIARALVRVDNVASLRAFEGCGFAPEATTCGLYVSAGVVGEKISAPPNAHLIAVSTLTYSGIWVEGEQSKSALRCAQAIRTRFGWDTAGAVFPVGPVAMASYEHVGDYRWLVRAL